MRVDVNLSTNYTDFNETEYLPRSILVNVITKL